MLLFLDVEAAHCELWREVVALRTGKLHYKTLIFVNDKAVLPGEGRQAVQLVLQHVLVGLERGLVPLLAIPLAPVIQS